MAFWGVEVKPGKPFAHKCDDLKPRLHISLATLGMGSGSATAKSTLQCNVGNKSPVYICSLSPGTSESLQLNLEFEEVDDVIFSVVGPRSIHLSGFYVCSGRNRDTNEESESYGEDIANTETERSDFSDDDEYDDSFIDDDGDPKVYSPSPISIKEKASRLKKPKRRRLQKKYQIMESDDDKSIGENVILDRNKNDQITVTNEDSLPISSLFKSEATANQEMNVLNDIGDASIKNGEDGGNSIINSDSKADTVVKDIQTHSEVELPSNLTLPSTEMDSEKIRGFKKIKKEMIHKGTISEADNAECKVVMIESEALKVSTESDNVNLKSSEGKDQNLEQINEEEVELQSNVTLPSTKVDPGKSRATKRKKKEPIHKGLISLDDNADSKYDMKVNNASKDKSKSDNVKCEEKMLPWEVELQSNVTLPSTKVDPGSRATKRKKKELIHKGSISENDNADSKYDMKVNNASKDKSESDNVIVNLCEEKKLPRRGDNVTQDFPDANQIEDRKNKKRKKKSESQGNVKVNNYDKPQSSAEVKNGTVEDDGKKTGDVKPFQVTRLSNGLVIEVLGKGAEDGKIAASGRKISVSYMGKLEESGEVFLSNVGQAPFKFRLGKGKVLKGWDVGLEGMQVGEQRRLRIPPSLGYGSTGHGETVPPNSWLVYDFTLVKVY